MRRKPLFTMLMLLFCLAISALPSDLGYAFCPNAPSSPNVSWSVADPVFACPAGDSISSANPTRLRITVNYKDFCDSVKVGIPLDSIYVTTFTSSGNVRSNPSCAFADQPTNAAGNTRITLSSFSGCGQLGITLFVSGLAIGTKYASVRSADTNVDFKVAANDTCAVAGNGCSPLVCDVNFDNSTNNTDRLLVANHLGHSLPNVVWNVPDHVSACPAGDTVVAGFPSQVRVSLKYLDGSYNPRAGTPPESVLVVVSNLTGNLRVNDQADTYLIFADDSTRFCGLARVTIPSMSGCGTFVVNLSVSGVYQGSRTIYVNTTDTNADGRVTSGDGTNPCDLNWDGVVDANDLGLINCCHLDHWHRNALHGSLVRRTNYCEDCPLTSANTKGSGQVFWSPSQRFISYTAFVPADPFSPACKVFIVPSDPKDGNALRQFTFSPLPEHDYDPSWSPLNTMIVFDRNDKKIIRKGLPWTSDTSEVLVTTSANWGSDQYHGDDYPAVSPDGQWVAFSRYNSTPPVANGGWSLWKIRINGQNATLLTDSTSSAVDFYPSWSPDGQTVYFQRNKRSAYGRQWTLWKVSASGGSAAPVFILADTTLVIDAVQPALSPDGKILVLGHGRRNVEGSVFAHTLDPALVAPDTTKLVRNYGDPSFAARDFEDFPILSPRMSPDGTRLVLGSKQVWAARRNMNAPPRIMQVGSLVPKQARFHRGSCHRRHGFHRHRFPP